MTSRFLTMPRSFWALFFSYCCMFVLGLADNIRGPLFPELISFFNLTNAAGSLSFAAASTAALFGTVLSSFILKKAHLDRLLAFSIFMMFLGLLIKAVAPNFGVYIVGALAFGYGMGSSAVAYSFLITENISEAIRSRVLSGLHALYGLSSLLAPFLASQSPHWFENSPQLAFLTTWRSAFFMTSFFTLIVLTLVLLVKAQPKFEFTKIENSSGLSNPKNRKTLFMLGIFFAAYVGAEILVSTRLALYMRTYFNMNLEQSSSYVTYFFVFLLIGRLFFAFKTLSYKLKTQMNMSLGLSLTFLLAGLYIHPFLLVLTGLTMAPFYPLAVLYISDITGVHKRKYLTFVMSVQSLLVIFMHIGVGYLTDAFGLFKAFGVGVILLIFSLVCLNYHPKIEV